MTTLGTIAAAKAAVSPLSGAWQLHATGSQFQSGTLHLRQKGTTVVGYYESKIGTTQMSGKLVNDQLSGTWRDPTGESGWLTLNFSETGNSFDGEWGYHGRQPEGKMVGRLMIRTP